MDINRRDLLKCLAAGGMVVAGGLWIPGRKLISIPNPGLIRSSPYDLFAIGPARNNIILCGPNYFKEFLSAIDNALIQEVNNGYKGRS